MDNKDKLYTSEEIAERYNVSPYTITQNWIKKGLKHMQGRGKGFLYKKEWIDEYIENQIMQNTIDDENVKIKKFKSSRNKKLKVNYVV